MSETMRVFLACALGAFIGTVVALEVNHYFWWLGLLAGGFTGYISYEFKKVMTAIPVAWRKAQGWQPDRAWWREFVQLIFAFGGLMTTFTTPIIMPLLFSLFNFTYAAALLLVGPFLLGIVIGTMSFENEPIEKLAEERRCLRLVSNPFRIYFWLLPKWTLKGGWWFLKHTPVMVASIFAALVGASILLGIFLNYLFREIHSDLRMLCGLDAAIGTVIGYFAGSAIIGGLAGGLWGAFNFEILSIRVLKLVPIEKSILR